MKNALITLFGLAACFGLGAAAWKALGYGDVTTAFDEAPDPNAPGPPVVVYVGGIEKTNFEFGRMNVNTEGRHVFEIKNGGESPLVFTYMAESCKCISASADSNTILPGETGLVELTWITPEEDGEFAHGATILTNVPNDISDQRAILLRVHGMVQAEVMLEPKELLFPSLTAGEQATAEFAIYSGVWEEFDLQAAKSEIADWVERIEPLSASRLARHQAKSGYRVRVRLPANLQADGRKSGYFYRELPLLISGMRSSEEAAPTGEPAQRLAKIPVRGTIRSGVVFLSSKMNSSGFFRIGFLEHGQGAKEQMTLIFREADESLEIKDILYDPRWFDITVTPQSSEGGKGRSFRIDITIPENAPACSYLGRNAVPVRIVTNAERSPVKAFLLEFAVHSAGVKKGTR